MASTRRAEVVRRHLTGVSGARTTPLFDGDVTIITGAGRGIGREAALLFARNGARLVLQGASGRPRVGGW